MPAGPFVDPYIGLDDNQAFAWLEEGYKDGSNMVPRLKASPDCEPLRTDPLICGLGAARRLTVTTFFKGQLYQKSFQKTRTSIEA